MNTMQKRSGVWRLLTPVLVVLQSFAGYALLVAQDPQVRVNVDADTNGGGAFYQTWWFWVLVGIFALIVIVAITARGRTVVSK